MTPVVSVVVPVFDVRPWLGGCLDSVLTQTENDIEVIAVDDGSTDGSGDMCDAYAVADSRVRVIHKSNGGLSEARNAGVAEATGEWVMFLDGDDWVDSRAIASMLATASETMAEVVIAGYHVDVHDSHGDVIRSVRRVPTAYVVDTASPAPPPLSEEVMNVLGYAWNKLYRRSLLCDAGVLFPVGVSLVEDILFNAPILARAERVAFVDDAFVHYVQRPRLTLGTKPQPEFGKLMARASKASAELLTAWSAPKDRVADLVHEVEVTRVQWAVRSVLCAGGPTRPRLVAARALLEDRAVRSVLQREVRQGSLSRLKRWVLASQARGYALPTLLVLLVRRLGR